MRHRIIKPISYTGTKRLFAEASQGENKALTCPPEKPSADGSNQVRPVQLRPWQECKENKSFLENKTNLHIKVF